MFILSKKLLVKKLRRKTACAFWFRISNEVSHRLTATVWLRGRDSNPKLGLMRPACCRYTTAQLNRCLFIVDSCSFRNCQLYLRGQQGSNLHRVVLQTTALPLELHPQNLESLRVIGGH